MKKQETDGGKLKIFLRDNEINQEDLAVKLGMTRQGLQYHLGKSKLDHEFKMKLREVGVMAFDEQGKLIDAPLVATNKDTHVTIEKETFIEGQKYLRTLEKQAATYEKYIELLEAENARLKHLVEPSGADDKKGLRRS